jgi:hypothetical protein
MINDGWCSVALWFADRWLNSHCDWKHRVLFVLPKLFVRLKDKLKCSTVCERYKLIFWVFSMQSALAGLS